MQKLIQALFRMLGVVWPALGGRLAYWFFFKPFRVGLRPAEVEIKKKGKEYSTQIHGKKTYYTVWGEGPTIIFAHGWSSKGLHYRKFVEPLVAKGYRVVIPDFPAHVKSEGKSSSVLEFRDTLLYLIDRYPDVHALVGHSLGAMAGIYAMIEHKVEVRKFIMINSAIWTRTIMRRFMEQINGNAKIEKRVRKKLLEQFGNEFDYFSTGYRIMDIKRMPEILVVVDDSDIEVPVEEGRYMSRLVNGELLVTFGLGHNKALRNDEAVDRMIRFLVK